MFKYQARETPDRPEAFAPPRLLAGAFLLSGLLLILPLWLTRLPPMSDFPAHAAALFLQMHAVGSPILSHLYRIEWTPVPDLGSELIVPLYASLLPVISATRLFVGLSVLLWVAGPAAVQYALFRRVTVTALAGALFAYNRNFIFGFVNYYFAAGVGFFVIAAWIASASRPALLRLVMLTVLFTALYFLHLLAMAFAAFFLLAFELSKIAAGRKDEGWRNAAVICGASLPAVLCLLIFPAGHGSESQNPLYTLLGFPERLLSLTWAGFAPEIVLLLVVTGLAIKSGIARIDERMRWPLAAVLILCLIAPVSLFGGWGLHIRYPAMGAALLFASLELRLSRRTLVAILALAVGATAVNAATLVGMWKTPAAQIEEIRSTLRQLPPGARLVTAMDTASVTVRGDFRHVAEYAVIDRAAFDPLAFTQKGQHILHVQPELQTFAAATSEQSDPVPLADLALLAEGAPGRPDLLQHFAFMLRWPCSFDNLLLLRLTGQHEGVPLGLERIAEGSVFTLYRIRHPATCGQR